MNETAKLFYTIEEPYAAGLFEAPERSYFYRHCLGYARYFENLKPAQYEEGELLYPCGCKFYDEKAIRPQFALTYAVDFDLLTKKSEKAARIFKEFYDVSHSLEGWTHAAPNYKRILKEGLSSYRERVEKRPEDTAENKDFREGLLALLNGMKNYLDRSVQYLRECKAPALLCDALAKVPFAPAETYYEGLVAWNMIAYFDGMDNLGCLDDGLINLYNGEDMTDVIRSLFANLEANGNWSCTIGTNGYNEITMQAIRAIKGKSRPMLELMVREDMPEKFWKAAVESLKAGTPSPSFYNAQGIHDMLKTRFPFIPDEELALFCGCGCTETNLQGLSRAGGTDGDLPLHVVFLEYMHENLDKYSTFDDFYEGFCQAAEARTNELLDEITYNYMYAAKYLPQPMRTLFTDDCIDNGKDYNAGGARYTWTMNSHSGMINTIDSLLSVRELIYRKKQFTPEEFIKLLDAEDETFFRILKTCPCYGVDNEDADTLAAAFAERMYRIYRNRPSYEFIDAFTLTDHQFLRYEGQGKIAGPTPDGRKGGMPTCDSIAAIRGKAAAGPTAMLKSAAKLPQHLVDGIAVLNLTLQKSFRPEVFDALIKSYFDLGGIQVQVTVTDAEELKDAMIHPEKHEDLIVRVGGYSEYFNRLTPALKQAVMERDIHSL